MSFNPTLASLGIKYIGRPSHRGELTFVSAVGARHVLFSAGYRNRFGHPRSEVIERYAEGGARIWRTDRDCALAIVLRADGVAVTAWRQARQRYWYGR